MKNLLLFTPDLLPNLLAQTTSLEALLFDLPDVQFKKLKHQKALNPPMNSKKNPAANRP
ncbi:MAG: hypothetical protein R2825_05055 [Saprospiraceae bacterium]